MNDPASDESVRLLLETIARHRDAVEACRLLGLTPETWARLRDEVHAAARRALETSSPPDRIAFVSDVHGCLPALAAAYDRATELADLVVCLGDVVDGAGEDDRCVEFLRERSIPCVLGNHDESCLASATPRVSAANRDYLASLPQSLRLGRVLAVHDNPLERARRGEGMWYRGSYVGNSHEAASVLDELREAGSVWPVLVVVGHTHVPRIFPAPQAGLLRPGVPYPLSEEKSYVLNPGSVADPRAGPPTFGVLRLWPLEFTVHEVAYG